MQIKPVRRGISGEICCAVCGMRRCLRTRMISLEKVSRTCLRWLREQKLIKMKGVLGH